MKKLVLAWLVGVGFFVSPQNSVGREFRFDRVEMAIPMQIRLYAPDEATANGAAEAVFARIHHLNSVFSDYDPESELRRLCDTSGGGIAVPVSEELFFVLQKAQQLSERSEGAFDPTISPVVRLWRRARRSKELPDPEKIAAAKQLVGYQNIKLTSENRIVELTKKGMQIDLGGIAKGYVVDEALAVLRKHGITRAMVSAGGNVGLGDPPPGKQGWRVGVPSLGRNDPPRQFLLLSRCALSTSGDTFQYVEIDGKRYSHIVDPKTGVGLTDHCCVTLVAPDGIRSDGLSTAVSVLGPEKGLKLIDKTPGVAGFIVRAPEGKEIAYESSRWKDLPVASSELPAGKPLPGQKAE
jgi:thiamine biosynthesis lipoprotein